MGLNARLLKFALSSAVASIFFGKAALALAAAAFGLAVARFLYLSSTSQPVPPVMSPVPPGKTRICVAGYTHSGPTAKAHYLADKIARKYPDKYETWYYFDQYAIWKYLQTRFATVPFPKELRGHSTSPFCWFERGPENVVEPVGGSDHLSAWAIKTFTDCEIVDFAKENWMSPLPYILGKSFHCNEGQPVPPATAKATL
jgi:hypothetical protein